MRNKKLQPLIYSFLIIIGLLLGHQISITTDQQSNYKKIYGVVDLIQDHYVDTINKKIFENKIVDGILENLDPHSAYINPEHLKEVEEDMQGSFSGIGVQFNIIEDSIVVVAPISGGPSEKLGVLSGDRIVEVDGENVGNIKIKNEGVIKRLRGKKGSVVNIKIYRQGNRDLLDFAILRDDIPLYSVDASMMLGKHIGYVKINRFSATTFDEFLEGINNLLGEEMKKLILDLRGNPGGYLGMAIGICDAILEKNDLIVYTEGRNRPRSEVYSKGKGLLENIEIIVLIDEGSASASEIVSGAIQDNDRGTIVGRRSFGKGLVQEQINLTDGSAIRLTTQRYYTPSGRCIQKDYGSNKKEYYLEHYSRTEKQDTVDLLVYTTKNGRKVYGGGGITPDIIIERDSNTNYSQINLVVSKGWVNEFCLKHSLLLKKGINQHNFIAKNNQNMIYEEFLSFIKEKDPNIKLSLGLVELLYFKTLLKATIARNLWGTETYYEILNKEDEFVKKAMSIFEKNMSP